MKKIIKTVVQFILNPHFLICFGIAWLITNGWSYILLALGTLLTIPWMIAVAGAYMTFLWFPFTPEKLLTVIISMALLRWLFPHDEKTLGILREMYAKLKLESRRAKEKRQKRKSDATIDDSDSTEPPANES